MWLRNNPVSLNLTALRCDPPWEIAGETQSMKTVLFALSGLIHRRTRRGQGLEWARAWHDGNLQNPSILKALAAC